MFIANSEGYWFQQHPNSMNYTFKLLKQYVSQYNKEKPSIMGSRFYQGQAHTFSKISFESSDLLTILCNNIYITIIP